MMAPCTRQNGAFTATGAGGSFPITLKGGVTAVAAEIVASPNVLPARLSQVAAAPKEMDANTPIVLTVAIRARRFVVSNSALNTVRSGWASRPQMLNEGFVSHPWYSSRHFPVQDIGSGQILRLPLGPVKLRRRLRLALPRQRGWRQTAIPTRISSVRPAAVARSTRASRENLPSLPRIRS